MDNRILFAENGGDINKGDEIQFASIKEQMQIVFTDEEGKSIIGVVSQIYTDTENDNETIGCEVKTNNNDAYDLFFKDGDKVYNPIKVPASISITPNEMKEKATVEREVKNPVVQKSNLFQGRTELDGGLAKFPDWDIVPPDQFINPRLKKR